MTLPRLNVYRHDRGARALVTLAGVIDPVTAPRVRAALEQCLRDGITLIDVDLTTVDRCDGSGLSVFLDVSEHAAEAQAFLLLTTPPRRPNDCSWTRAATVCSIRRGREGRALSGLDAGSSAPGNGPSTESPDGER
ncbi:STAS domain-containing protein [Streptomyces griseoincarnatus]